MALHLTGSIDVSGSITSTHFSGSFSGSFQGDGSRLTGVGGGDTFPYTGSAEITGSLGVTGSVSFSHLKLDPSAWSAGGALSTARYGLGGAGTQTAGLAFGGYATGFVFSTATEEYNGASWSTVNPLSTGRKILAGAGTQGAGLAFGGYDENNFAPGACTEEYNGATWGSGGALATPRYGLAGAGTQTAGLAFGGKDDNYSVVSCTEEYGGTAWTAGGPLSDARCGLGGVGTQTAGLAFGGYSYLLGNNVSCTEEYNGVSWTAGGALITARLSVSGAGTQTAGLAFGGIYSAHLSCTEEYDGTSWSAGGALITARSATGGAGTQDAGLAFGGVIVGSFLTCTEEYNPATTRTLTKTFDYSKATGEIAATGSLKGTLDGTATTVVDDSITTAKILNDSITYDKIEGRYTAISTINFPNSTQDLDAGSFSIFNITGNLNSTQTLNITGMKTGQVISILATGVSTLTLTSDSTSELFNNLGAVTYDGASDNSLQIICISDLDSAAIYNYTISTYTADNTPN